MSEVFDRIPRMIRWLEEVLSGLEVCSFMLDQECDEDLLFECRQEYANKDELRLIIKEADNIDNIHVDSFVSRRQLLEEFYSGLKMFSNSSSYKPEYWEEITFADRFHEITGFSLDDTIDNLISYYTSVQLKKILFNIAPRYQIDWPMLDERENWRKSVSYAYDRENKEHQLGMRRTKCEWLIDENYDSFSVSKKRKYLRDYLATNVSNNYGTRLRDIHSFAIESYLRN